MITPLYTVWPGKQRFYFKGRFMRGPSADWLGYWITWGLLTVLPIFYSFVFIPYLWTNVTPFLPIAFIILYVQSLVFLLITMSSDPGIIPRRSVFLASSGEVPNRFAKPSSVIFKTGVVAQHLCYCLIFSLS